MALLFNPFYEDNFGIFPMQGRPVFSQSVPYAPRRNVNRHNPLSFNILEDLFAPEENFGHHTKDTETSFESVMDLKGYNPKEVEVTLDPNTRIVLVKGTKKEESTHGAFQKHFMRTLALPENCSLDKVKTSLNKDGVLKISAPKSQESLEHKEDRIHQVKAGHETIEVEDMPEEDQGKEKAKDCQMNEEEEKKAPKPVQKLEIEVEEEPKPAIAKPAEEEESKLQKNDAFEFKMNIEGFDPKNIQVQMNLARGVLSINAVKKTEQDGAIMVSQNHRDVIIDGDIFDLRQLKCEMDEDSKNLVITAPRASVPLTDETKTIPIMFK